MLNRIADGGRINRNKPLNFTFNGSRYQGYEGDTLASALLANNIKIVGRSFKYHRPRAIISAGVEEFNGLVKLESGPFDEPSVRATCIELYEGLKASSQHCWPSVNFDFWAGVSLLTRFMPAGFYYKTFIWPNWHIWEGYIRKAAGLGTLPTENDPDRYDKQSTHCDILIVGGGPAGLAAATAAGQSGLGVILVDDQPELGGSLLWDKKVIDNLPAEKWVHKIVLQLQQMDNIIVLNRSSVFAYYDHNMLAAVERVTDHLPLHKRRNSPRQRLWKIRAKKVVLATGAIERPMTFANNDRPGIMLASAVSHYINRYAVLPGKNVVIATNNDSAYQTALDLFEAGAMVSVVDARQTVNSELAQIVQKKGIIIYCGNVVVNSKGYKSVRTVQIATVDSNSKISSSLTKSLQCDLVAMSGGWNPTVHLFSQSGGKLTFNQKLACFVPDISVQEEQSIGAANGSFSLKEAIEEGFAVVDKTYQVDKFVIKEDKPNALLPIWQISNQPKAKQWLDFQYDVTIADVEMAVQENFVSVEHFKRYTGTGMAIDQGKTSNVNALAVLGESTNRKIAEVGTTTFRPPYLPVSTGLLVGQEFNDFYYPKMEMPAHRWHQAHGAVFEDAAGWQRPSYYLLPDETPVQAIDREVVAARNHAGLFEGSPLGKIEVHGKDASEFLNRIYLNNMKTLKVGFIRYGLMLNENGIIIDDGVLSRFSENHYQVGTTSAGAKRIYLWMEEWLQCEWRDLDVQLTQVTDQWAVCTLTGPKARQVLAKLKSNIDLSADNFPHMTFREGTLANVPVRIFRVSFTGELSYEINVPANYGLSLWQTLITAGAEYNITPYGIEAIEILRTEKGYLHLGTDTDGRTCPADVGWAGPVNNKKDDFIGKRSLFRSHNLESGRKEFVGIQSTSDCTLPIGAHLIDTEHPEFPVATQGYVTSSCYSPTLGKSIALGLLRNGFSRTNQNIYVYDQGKIYDAEIVSPIFYDPTGERLNA